MSKGIWSRKSLDDPDKEKIGPIPGKPIPPDRLIAPHPRKINLEVGATKDPGYIIKLVILIEYLGKGTYRKPPQSERQQHNLSLR